MCIRDRFGHERSDRLDITQGVFIQPKLDGVRCYTRLVDGEVKMFSRNHKEFKNVKHITTQLKPILTYYPELILDGELYNHKFKDSFNEIISMVRTSKPDQRDRFKSATYLQYHVYDLFDQRRPELSYLERYDIIRHIFDYKYRKSTRYIKTVETHFVKTQKKIDQYHINNKYNGYEGSMLRANEAYQQRRSHGLQKVKDFSDTEITITGFVEGKGKFTGGLGKFLGVDDDGREIEVPFQRCTIANRKKIWENRKNYLNKVATFEYFERTPSGNYRFPQFKTIRDYEG